MRHSTGLVSTLPGVVRTLRRTPASDALSTRALLVWSGTGGVFLGMALGYLRYPLHLPDLVQARDCRSGWQPTQRLPGPTMSRNHSVNNVVHVESKYTQLSRRDQARPACGLDLGSWVRCLTSFASAHYSQILMHIH